MVWTTWFRGACKVLMAIEILIVLITGVRIISKASDLGSWDGAFLGLGVIVGGTLLVIIVFSFAMMISEISVNVNRNNNNNTYDNPSQPNQPTQAKKQVYTNANDREVVIIPEGTKVIREAEFHNCPSLNNVKIPESVTAISDNAFALCPKLTTVQLNNGLKTIGVCAFCDCPSLNAIAIPQSVTKIEDYALGYCFDTATNTFKKVEGFRILGYPNSEAERYAKIRNIDFMAL